MANEYYPQGMHTQQMPQQQQYRQYQQPQYQQSQYQPPRQMSLRPPDTTSTGQWVLNLFLAAIPIVGLVLLLVWAFSSNTAPSKQNWARATLIWILIAILLTIILCFVCIALGIPFQDYIPRYRG